MLKLLQVGVVALLLLALNYHQIFSQSVTTSSPITIATSSTSASSNINLSNQNTSFDSWMQKAQPYMTLFRDIVTALAAIIAMIVSVMGLNEWRRQLKGKADYEVAQKLLRAVYKVRSAVEILRHPYISTGEFSEATKDKGTTSSGFNDEANQRGQRDVYDKRWELVYEAISEVDIYALDVEAVGNDEINEKLKPLRKCVRTLEINISKYFWYRNKKNPVFNEEEFRKIENVIYSRPESPEIDEFGIQVNEAVKTVKDYLKPHLQ